MQEEHPHRKSYLSADFRLWKWFVTTDHKRIAILYMVSVTLMFFIGGLAAAAIRLELVTPEGDLMTSDMYNRAFSAHGIIMVWFFLIPAIPAVFGNFLTPLMIGARDMAFPRINLASWYIYVAGALLVVYAIVMGGVDTGWYFYTPLSTVYADGYVIIALLGVLVVGYSSILTALNIIVTVHKLRAPGMTWSRLPLFLWSNYATSLILVLATPVLSITIVLVILERWLGIGVFDPRLGGDPLLFQHLFWFYSHPAVYIMILPGMGVVSELITAFSRRRIFGYKFVAGASLAIALIGFFVWGHHMFVAGQSIYASTVFSFLSFLVAVPSAIKVYNWTTTMIKGEITLAAPMLYALGFIGLFVIGGITGLFLASLAVDLHVHNTYYLIAHFHFIMVGAQVTAYLGALHFWWPKITGRLYPSGWGRVAALLIFIGFVLTFFPQYIVGYLGMPRRYHAYDPEWQALNIVSSGGAVILALGYALPLFYLLWSLRYGRAAGHNPWGASGLEWTTPSPPPVHNFMKRPVVTWEAYDYPVKGWEHG